MGKRTEEKEIFHGVEERLVSVPEEEEEAVISLMRLNESTNRIVRHSVAWRGIGHLSTIRHMV